MHIDINYLDKIDILHNITDIVECKLMYININTNVNQ